MMKDDLAKQSTDTNSGQNMASDDDMHRATLNSSNPAFHALAQKGLKGEIEPVILNKTEEGEKVGDVKVKSSGKKISAKNTLAKNAAAKNTSGKKTSGKNTSAKKSSTKKASGKKTSVKKLSAKKKSIEAKASEGPGLADAVKGGEDSFMPSNEMSGFSQWLSGLAPVVSPYISNTTMADAAEEASSKSADASQLVKTRKSGPESDEAKSEIERAKSPHSKKRVESVSTVGKVKRKKKIAKAGQNKKKRKKKKKRTYDSGVVLSDDIFSETLADLLASQGHKTQAIHMYEKMRLIYPEKTRFFAAKIEKLNKKV